jgi:hypothetical protein
VALRLLRCRVELRTRRGKVIGRGERFHRDARSFKVDVDLTPRGRKLLHRRKLRRGVLVARGTDSVGRTDVVRRRVRF